MTRTHLTLAALATSAVAGLDVVGAQRFGSPGGDFDSALITSRDGHHWIVRIPRSERAEAEQSADLISLRALTPGVRARLPFAVSTFAGQVAVDGTRAVVTDFVYGSKVPLAQITIELASSIGTAIAAIHALPPGVVLDVGLPTQSANDAMRASAALMEKAIATGLVPAALVERWRSAATDSALWQFTPTVINASLASDSFLSVGDDVTGVLGWHAMRVGDPARDLQWLIAGRALGIADAAFAAYTRARGGADRRLRQRATLLSELEVARWLLHGTKVRSTEIVDDAVEMLSSLVDEVQNDLMNPLGAPTLPVLDVDEVQQLLDRTERVRSAG